MVKKKTVKKKNVKLSDNSAPVESYKHKDKRVHIPTQEESVKLTAKQKQPVKKKYEYDPSLDPQLVWAGKKEAGSEFGVPTVPIYVQENISPEAIIARLKTQDQGPVQFTLFGETANDQVQKAVEFYKHEDNWANRMILGDSLLVMNSLLEKEGMRGKVQTVYIDPPYGIKFGSNWQVSINKTDVKDNKLDDLVRQPEQVKAFRDTWELGIHSYLAYLRDRILLARELLSESGSCFVQISDENVHHLREIMDEVFNAENYCNQIIFKKKSGLSSNRMESTYDVILWYSKDKNKMKYRQLYEDKETGVGETTGKRYDQLESPDGKTRRPMTIMEKENPNLIPNGWKPFKLSNPCSISNTDKEQPPIIIDGKKYYPPKGRAWATTIDGMNNLLKKNRLISTGKNLAYVLYLDDFPVIPITDIWLDLLMRKEKIYVVQTAEKVIQRCIQMSSDPGDLIFDPTCGSGTTGYVAEECGRRWIIVDTSRVSISIARSRLMSSLLPYYDLNDSTNIQNGFKYNHVDRITLRSVAHNEPSEKEILYNKPIVNKNKLRVSGPFTVESLAPHRVSDAQEMVSSEKFIETVIQNMLSAGVQTGEKGARLEFSNLEVLPSGPEIQAVGEYKTKDGLKKVAVAIGPEFGSIDDDFILDAARVAKKFAQLLVVAATSFDGSAASVSKEIEGVQVMKVKINPDLSMGDLLKKTSAANLFLAFGDPDVKIHKSKDGIQVEVLGVDVYDPVKGEIRSSKEGNLEYDIAAWFIDTNYNDQAFFINHAYFLGDQNPYEKLKKALKADIPEELWDELNSTISRSFPKPKTGKIAVKVINHYGDEVMKVIHI